MRELGLATGGRAVQATLMASLENLREKGNPTIEQVTRFFARRITELGLPLIACRSTGGKVRNEETEGSNPFSSTRFTNKTKAISILGRSVCLDFPSRFSSGLPLGRKSGHIHI